MFFREAGEYGRGKGRVWVRAWMGKFGMPRKELVRLGLRLGVRRMLAVVPL